jgi:GT2 family glycosyltransferase
MSGAPTFAIAIPTYRREQVLLDTIASVLAECPGVPLLVVDQTPTHEPQVAAQLASWASAGVVRIVTQGPSLTKARNRALRELEADVVVFLDDDVVLAPGFLAAYREVFAQSDVAAAGGRVRVPAARAWPARPSWPMIRDYHYLDVSGVQPIARVASVRGCNHAVRREAALAVGGYDETYDGWALREETDLMLRLLWAGGRVAYVPGADLLHLEAPSGGTRQVPRVSVADVAARFDPVLYFAWRHLFPHGEFWKDVTYRQLREHGAALLRGAAGGSRLRLAAGFITALWRSRRRAAGRADRCPQDVARALWSSVGPTR